MQTARFGPDCHRDVPKIWPALETSWTIAKFAAVCTGQNGPARTLKETASDARKAETDSEAPRRRTAGRGMIRLFRRASADPKPGPGAVFDPPEPEHPLYVIGDIHGRADLLDHLLEAIERDADARGLSEAARIVMVGDMIDRGARSDEVLSTVHDMASRLPDRVIALMGNHERMMLDFLAGPTGEARAWIRYGGLETLHAFGVGGIGPKPTPERAERAAHDLAQSATQPVLDWLEDLPLQYRSGNVGVVHAGADPAVSLDQQEPGALLWGHRDFHRLPRQDGMWIVYGHTIVSAPVAQEGRIAVDTGAYESGCLTAAAIWQGEVRFLQV